MKGRNKIINVSNKNKGQNIVQCKQKPSRNKKLKKKKMHGTPLKK